MEARFTEGWRAAVFVISEITRVLPEGNALSFLNFEVTLHRLGTVTRQICSLEHLEQVLHEFCVTFPRAVAHFHPDSAYGFIAQIECACSLKGCAGCCKTVDQECAVITVVLGSESIGLFDAFHVKQKRAES